MTARPMRLRRRTALGAFAASFASISARARTGLPTVGYVAGGQKGDALNALWETSMREGLAEQGFTIPGKLNWIDRYSGGYDQEGMTRLARELVDLGAELLLSNGLSTRAAIAGAAGRVPVIYAFSGDPIAAGLADSLIQPRYNATGVTLMVVETNAKRIELLKELAPQTRRIALLSFPNHPGEAREIEVCRRAVSSLGIELLYLRVFTPQELDKALDEALAAKVDSVVGVQGGVVTTYRSRIAAWAIDKRLPFASGWSIFADDGALMTYGPSVRWSFARAGSLAAKVLRGAKPADLPIEQPTEFELVLNARTAQAIGLDIPAKLRSVADRLIE
jgi:putative ABC transport system substrate-binding protein